MALSDPNQTTDRELLAELGQRLKALRKSQHLTATEAGQRTGLSRRTVWRAEQGDNPTLLTLVRLLRLYGRLDALQDFLQPPEVSPMAVLRDKQKLAPNGPRGDA